MKKMASKYIILLSGFLVLATCALASSPLPNGDAAARKAILTLIGHHLDTFTNYVQEKADAPSFDITDNDYRIIGIHAQVFEAIIKEAVHESREIHAVDHNVLIQWSWFDILERARAANQTLGDTLNALQALLDQEVSLDSVIRLNNTGSISNTITPLVSLDQEPSQIDKVISEAMADASKKTVAVAKLNNVTELARGVEAQTLVAWFEAREAATDANSVIDPRDNFNLRYWHLFSHDITTFLQPFYEHLHR